ncbi:unnamed protein product [Closterium sp. NIES-64]|nr:unnamed protein product [Closterium sp. NIES-64]
MAAQELCWLTYLLIDLGEPPLSPPVLYVDNKAMLALCREHRLEHRTKHIALRYFLARELQQCGQLRLAYMASEANTADIFTKALPPCDHQRFCMMLASGWCADSRGSARAARVHAAQATHGAARRSPAERRAGAHRQRRADAWGRAGVHGAVCYQRGQLATCVRALGNGARVGTGQQGAHGRWAMGRVRVLGSGAHAGMGQGSVRY